MTLETLANHVWSPLTAPHALGDGSLTVADSTGFLVGTRVSVVRGVGANSEQILFIASVTAITGNVLTLGGFLEGTADQAARLGDRVELRPTAGQWNDMVTAVQASGTGSVTSVAVAMPGGFTVGGSPVTTSGTITVSTSLAGIVKGASGSLTTATAGVDYVTPSGSITGTAGGLTGSISESQVTGLTTDLASKATDTLAVHLAGVETITGTKTFSQAITGNLVGNVTGNVSGTAGTITGSISESQVTGLTTDLATITGNVSTNTASIASNTSAIASKATDTLAVHLAGVETITGTKTFTAPPIDGPGTTVFNSDGTITESYGGLTVVTNFNADGSVTQVYGGSVTKTRTITFTSGNITETLT